MVIVNPVMSGNIRENLEYRKKLAYGLEIEERGPGGVEEVGRLHDISPFWDWWNGGPEAEEGCFICHIIGKDVLEVFDRDWAERLDGEEIFVDCPSSGLFSIFDSGEDIP